MKQTISDLTTFHNAIVIYWQLRIFFKKGIWFKPIRSFTKFSLKDDVVQSPIVIHTLIFSHYSIFHHLTQMYCSLALLSLKKIIWLKPSSQFINFLLIDNVQSKEFISEFSTKRTGSSSEAVDSSTFTYYNIFCDLIETHCLSR